MNDDDIRPTKESGGNPLHGQMHVKDCGRISNKSLQGEH